jgi:hypothetical protein
MFSITSTRLPAGSSWVAAQPSPDEALVRARAVVHRLLEAYEA